MTILKKTAIPAKFKELGVGDCFKYHDGLYMRIPDGDNINAICLQNGELTALFNEEIVFPIRTELAYRLCDLGDL